MLTNLKIWFWLGPKFGICLWLGSRKSKKALFQAVLKVTKKEGAAYLLVRMTEIGDEKIIHSMEVAQVFLTQARIKELTDRGFAVVKIEKIN